MPNILVRGHMRFESDSDEDRKQVLEERIRLLECEVEGLRKELNDHLAFGIRTVKRDSIINAVDAFDKEIAQYKDIAGPGAGWLVARARTEDEIVAEVHQQLLEMMVTVRCLYPNVGLERIFWK